MKHLALTVLLISGWLTTSCATTNTNTISPATYSETAKKNFDAANRALQDKRYDEAVAHFEFIRNKYPYSSQVADSDLLIADAYFAQEKWLEASDAYDFFIRFHPVHEKVSYAYFKKAKANVNAMPSDFFILPSAFTKDQKSTLDALESIEQFLKQFPHDPFVKEAQEMRTMLRDRVAQKHIYVAQFYVSRKKWKGASLRLAEVIGNFTDTPSARQAFIDLAVIKKNYLEEKDEAKDLLNKLVSEFPDSNEARKATSMLKDYM